MSVPIDLSVLTHLNMQKKKICTKKHKSSIRPHCNETEQQKKRKKKNVLNKTNEYELFYYFLSPFIVLFYIITFISY